VHDVNSPKTEREANQLYWPRQSAIYENLCHVSKTSQHVCFVLKDDGVGRPTLFFADPKRTFLFKPMQGVPLILVRSCIGGHAGRALRDASYLPKHGGKFRSPVGGWRI
jgi:hypothetical protein